MKATVIFVILLIQDVWRATLQKESPIQKSLADVFSQMFFKIGFLEISQYLQENMCVVDSF